MDVGVCFKRRCKKAEFPKVVKLIIVRLALQVARAASDHQNKLVKAVYTYDP